MPSDAKTIVESSIDGRWPCPSCEGSGQGCSFCGTRGWVDTITMRYYWLQGGGFPTHWDQERLEKDLFPDEGEDCPDCSGSGKVPSKGDPMGRPGDACPRCQASGKVPSEEDEFSYEELWSVLDWCRRFSFQPEKVRDITDDKVDDLVNEGQLPEKLGLELKQARAVLRKHPAELETNNINVAYVFRTVDGNLVKCYRDGTWVEE